MKKTFRLQGLGCANCAAKMERGIGKLEGVENVSVNFLTTKMIIEASEQDMPQILEAAEKIIHKLEPDVVIGRG